MTKNPSRKPLKAFVLIEVIQIHFSRWEVVIVCLRTPRGIMMRNVTIFPQGIQFHFGEWEATVVKVYRRLGEVGIFKFVLIVPQAIPNLQVLRLMGFRTTSRSVRARSQGRSEATVTGIYMYVVFAGGQNNLNHHVQHFSDISEHFVLCGVRIER